MYISRIADKELEERLGAAGAVLIEGPRACGKTETARRRAASEVLFDVDEYARQAMAIDPALVLAGDRPRLIDEWQIEPAIWNHVRREVDRSRGPGQFMFTGSAVPADDVTRHTGAGRISRLRLRPMSSVENVYHYRDNTNLEVDALVQNRWGDWCAFEVKLGAGQVDAAAASLSKFRERVDLAAAGKPGMLGIIVGSGYGYVRNDGIAVIPIGALAP